MGGWFKPFLVQIIICNIKTASHYFLFLDNHIIIVGDSKSRVTGRTPSPI